VCANAQIWGMFTVRIR